MEIRLEQFTDKNISDYEKLTKYGDDGKVCYCSFWHAKWDSMDEFYKAKENPERLKTCVIERMRSNFHVGVIAYVDDKPGAWISVGPLTDFYWSWKRIAHIGEIAKTTARIMCFAIAPEFRGQNLQAQLLFQLAVYGKEKAWTSIEAYPFAKEAIEKHGNALKWPGVVSGFENAGFRKLEDHWLSSSDAQRYIYKIDL